MVNQNDELRKLTSCQKEGLVSFLQGILFFGIQGQVRIMRCREVMI